MVNIKRSLIRLLAGLLMGPFLAFEAYRPSFFTLEGYRDLGERLLLTFLIPLGVIIQGKEALLQCLGLVTRWICLRRHFQYTRTVDGYKVWVNDSEGLRVNEDGRITLLKKTWSVLGNETRMVILAPNYQLSFYRKIEVGGQYTSTVVDALKVVDGIARIGYFERPYEGGYDAQPNKFVDVNHEDLKPFVDRDVSTMYPDIIHDFREDK